LRINILIRVARELWEYLLCAQPQAEAAAT